MKQTNLTYAYIFLLSMVLSGCLFSESADQKNDLHLPTTTTLDQVLKQKKLTALTNNSPSSYYIYKGEPLGYEYELLEHFCDYLNVSLEIKVINDIENLLDSVQAGSGEIATGNLTITSSRQQWVDFTHPMLRTKQVLIQRKPKNFWKLTRDQQNKALIRDVTQLAGKTIHVRAGSSFAQRAYNLNEEIGGGIEIVEMPGSIETDSVLALVSQDSIDYTIIDENLAQLFARNYKNLDVKTPVSFSQNIGWALSKESETLRDTINFWLQLRETKKLKSHIYNKYFKWRRKAIEKIHSPFNLASGGHISDYDELIKSVAERDSFDWRLLSSVVYKESKFDPNAISWTGAIGLMQMLPSTAQRFGIDSVQLHQPEENLKAGGAYLRKLTNYWLETIQDSTQALKFGLASYNVGLGHIKDAQRLAVQNNLDDTRWDDNVELMVLKLSDPEIYRNNDIVKHGYCRGKEPYYYVKEIFSRYRHYNNFIL